MDGVKLGFTRFLGVYGSLLDLKSVWDAIPTFSMPFNPTYGLTGVCRESEFAPTRIAVSSQQESGIGVPSYRRVGNRGLTARGACLLLFVPISEILRYKK